MNIADPVIHFLRERDVDVMSAREQGWGSLSDSETLLDRSYFLGFSSPSA